MYVGSAAELNLIAFGWMLYDNLWALLAFVGLVMVPFTWTLFMAVFDAVKKHGFSGPDAPITAFYSVFASFMVMMLVYVVACIPMVSLSVDKWEYSQICTANGVEQVEGRTLRGDETLVTAAGQLISGSLKPVDAKVPILWDVIQRIGAGMSRALNSGGACPNNSTYMDGAMRKLKFAGDPSLQGELAQFTKDCFLPARSRLMSSLESGTLTTVPTPAAAVDRDQYYAAKYREWTQKPKTNDEVFDRSNDPNYIGSHFYLSVPGLYAPAQPGQYDIQGDTLRASKPVAGWSYDPVRDCSHSNDAAGDFCTNHARNEDLRKNRASPTCDEWWNDSEIGLKRKLFEAADTSVSLYNNGPVDPNTLQTPTTQISASEALNSAITQTTGASKSKAWLEDKIIATAMVNDSNSLKAIETATKDLTAYEGPPINAESPLIVRIGVGFAAVAAMAFSAVAAEAATAAAASAAVSIAGSAAEFYAFTYMVKSVYPIAIAYIEMFFIAMLPFMMVASMYDLGRLLQFALIFLAIQFLSPWRYIVEYLDERLFSLMYPDNTLWGTAATLVDRILLDVTTSGMYIVFPIVLLWLITLAGAGSTSGIIGALSTNGAATIIKGASSSTKAPASKKPKAKK
ncbi:hypothetical protein HDN1F_35170 [gamma proteobacterium HdN1]|nr:Hypothetical protein HDN1F_18010 [gamma proteobacterium HdN1]CBL47100.1 hypothetical protein HDN1F_35170 [gamma proteobacterium HdN1]